MANVKMKLFDDLCKIFREDLLEIGYDTSTITDQRSLMILYFTMRNRLIKRKPRRVEKALGFLCPTDLQSGLSLLESKIQKGEDLCPHLSRTIKDFSFEDLMLFDWGIHHFHLGTEMEADNYIKRTGEILYSIVTQDCVYFIKIQLHGEWSNVGLLEVVHNNWPELLNNYKIEGQLTFKASSTDIQQLRKAHVNMMVELPDGSAYMGRGMGIMSDGSSADAALKTTDKMHECKKLQNNIEEHITQQIKMGNLPDEEYEIIACRNGSGIIAKDEKHGLIWCIYQFGSIKKDFSL